VCGAVTGHGQAAAQSSAPPAITAPAASGAAPAAPTAAAAAPSTGAPTAPDDVPPQGAPVPPRSEMTLAELPRDLTPLGMFLSADIVVKAVMLGLVLASVLTWTIWLAKTLELAAARRRLARAHQILAGARSLGEVVRLASATSPHVALLIRAAEGELRRSPDLRDAEGIKERIAARFERIAARLG